jgi:hypothetical protein
MKVDRRVRVRDLRILDVEPIMPGEPKAALVLDRLAPFLSSAASVDEAFAAGFEFNTHVVEAALGPASFLDCMPSGRTRRAAPWLFAYLSMNSIVCSSAAGETLKRPV